MRENYDGRDIQEHISDSTVVMGEVEVLLNEDVFTNISTVEFEDDFPNKDSQENAKQLKFKPSKTDETQFTSDKVQSIAQDSGENGVETEVTVEIDANGEYLQSVDETLPHQGIDTEVEVNANEANF